MTDDRQANKVAELEEKLRLLTLENDQLAERAEETLLLGMIAEKISALGSVDAVLRAGLEQIAILKGIPYAACFSLEGGQACGLEAYTLEENSRFKEAVIPLNTQLMEDIVGGGCVMRGDQHDRFPYHRSCGCRFEPLYSMLLPLNSHRGLRLLFVFATDRSSDRLEGMSFLLPRVADMVASRIDNLELLDQVTRANEELDRKVQERTEKLRDSEHRSRTLFESTYDAFVVIDRDLRFRDVNAQACRSMGYTREELLLLGVQDIVVGKTLDEVNRLWEEASQEDVFRLNSLHSRKDGSTFPVEVQLGLIRIGEEELLLAQVRDMSERNRLREQLSQAQKMEAVGRLAGGIAHDFNNILTTIMGHADLLKMDLEDNPSALEDLSLIQETAEKAARLTHQLLAFSRKQVMEMATFSLNGNLTELSRMLQRMITENIELTMDLDPAAGHIFGDPGRVEQIVVNLVINARDAMPEGGRIAIRTRVVPGESDFPQAFPEGSLPTGRFLEIEVRDTGEGIPPENLSRIFDPFFTTKDVGKGSGLGLAMVYGLARQHHATVRVQSEPDEGAAFQVIFPEVEPEEDGGTLTEETLKTGGGELVLLVEDDPSIRQVLSRMITRLGYRLLVADNGQKALELNGLDAERIDLVLTDVIMPRMGGGELVQILRRRNAGLKVIFISGYTDDDLRQEALTEPGTRFLQKPVAYAELASEMRDLLGGAEEHEQDDDPSLHA